MNSELNKLIDCCIDTDSDFNISKTIHFILKNKYRYNGNKKWEYYDTDNNIWRPDNKSNLLKKDIEILVTNEFLKRIEYWNIMSKNNKNNTDYINDCQVKINKLLICSNKIKNKNYIITIIKEARSLFEYEN
jgi:hypothetical protein